MLNSTNFTIFNMKVFNSFTFFFNFFLINYLVITFNNFLQSLSRSPTRRISAHLVHNRQGVEMLPFENAFQPKWLTYGIRWNIRQLSDTMSLSFPRISVTSRYDTAKVLSTATSNTSAQWLWTDKEITGGI